MKVISFSKEDLARDDTRYRVQFNSEYVFLLPKDLEELTNAIEGLTNGITGECRVRFAYEIHYQDYAITLCQNTENFKVQSLSQTLAKINHDSNNLPTEKVLLIVPDEIDLQFVNELFKQMCLLQIPFDIQKESYRKFTTNSEQFKEDLNKLKTLCAEFNVSDKEINSLVKTDLADTAKSVESLLNQKKNVPTLIALEDFPFNFDLTDFGLPVKCVQKLSSEVLPKDAGCVFVINDENNDLGQLSNYKKLDRKNILFLLKKNTNNPNVPLYLAKTAEKLKTTGFGDSCLTFIDDNNIDSAKNIIGSFCTYLRQKSWNLMELIDDLNDTFSQLENNCSKFFDKSSYDVEKKKLSANKLHTEVKCIIDNEELLFHDILLKVLLYDSQQYIEKYFNDFQIKYSEVLDEFFTNVHFGEEKTLRSLYKGQVPPDITQILNEKDIYLNKTYNSMAVILQKYIKDFFAKRVTDFIKLLPEDLNEEFKDYPLNQVISLNSSKVYSLDWLKKILSAEQFKMLVRHNSQVLSFKTFRKANENLADNDIIFLEINFRKELKRFLEFEFNKKAASLKLNMTWEISSAIEKSWLKISDVVHNRIEVIKKDFSSSLKEIDNDNKCLRIETNEYVKFLREIQRATEKLRMLV